MFGVITNLSKPADFFSRSRPCQDFTKFRINRGAKAEGNYIYRLGIVDIILNASSSMIWQHDILEEYLPGFCFLYCKLSCSYH